MKKFITISAILLLSLVLAMPASALRSSVYFLGQADSFVFHPGTSWSDTDLFDNFKGLMPGDTRTEEINVRNASNDCDRIKLYLKAEAIDDPATADFLAQLNMTVKNGDSVIYQASPDQVDGLGDFVSLGAYKPGESTTLNVILEVPITLGNEYMHRDGNVDWVFMAECYVDGEIVDPEPGEDEPKPLPVDPTPNHGPQTEDFIIQSVAILIISVLGLFLAIIFLRRSKKDDAEEDKE